jgi:hypothetical protein
MSEARLARMHEVVACHVARSTVPGMLTLVRVRGEVHVEAIGMLASDGSEAMRRETIFRIASATKPIVAAAAMILVVLLEVRPQWQRPGTEEQQREGRKYEDWLKDNEDHKWRGGGENRFECDPRKLM